MNTTIQCTKCNSSISVGAGFGMTACPQCGEIVLLDSVAKPPENLGPSSAPLDAAPEAMFFTPKPTTLDAEPPKPDGDPDFNDVVEFGNQEQPATSTGILVYDVKIAGVDTIEMREAVSSCFKDKRFGIDPQVVSQIKNGELILKHLHPVKATVLLGRLKHLPFKITWVSRQLIKGLKIFVILNLGILFYAHASEWERHEINLKGYVTRMNNAQDDIEELIRKKKANRDPKVRDQLLVDINKKHDELRKMYQDFRDEEEHVRFEHPEQGDKTEHQYRHFKLKSVEEMEKESGLDGQLTRIKAKAEKKYQKPE